MIYREYGTTGIRVSALGFGCMRFPMRKGHVDADRTIHMLHRAVDLGINYLDSAYVYCNEESEAVLGEAVEGRRTNLYLSTKNHYKGDDPAKWRRYLDTSLERLNTDYIDFYHLHDLRLREYLSHLKPHGAMEEARKAKDEGLIRHLCFSSHDEPENIAKLIDTGEFEGLLVQYNILDRRNEEVIARAHEKGLGVSIMGTVAGGKLIPRSSRLNRTEGHRWTIPQLAIRFVLSNSGVSAALSGMENVGMLESNVASVSPGPLNPQENQQILQIADDARRLRGLYCTGCSYCMPCPSGVDIPANFAAYNLARVWGLRGMARARYRALGRTDSEAAGPSWAAACKECGQCESKCPQNLPIMKKLMEVRKALE